MPSYPHRFQPGDTVTIRPWDDYDFPVCSLVLPVFESSLTFDDLLKGAAL